MIAANMAPVMLNQPSYWTRLIFSCAAPIFVMLAGSMVGRSVIVSSKNGLNYFLRRGLFLLAAGAFTDIIASGYFPFLSIDVLYLLGVSMPLLFLVAQLSTFNILLLTLLIFAFTVFGQSALGYSKLPTILYLTQRFSVSSVAIFKHWLIDGWFPLLPWFGICTSGILLGRLRWEQTQTARLFNQSWILGSALAMLGAGFIFMNLYPGPQYNRIGYQELFYPVSLGFLLFAISMVFCVIALVDATRESVRWELFQPLGEASLFVYLAHSVIIGKVYLPYFSPMGTSAYVIAFLLLFLSLLGCTHWLRGVRKEYPQMPTVLKWVLG